MPVRRPLWNLPWHPDPFVSGKSDGSLGPTDRAALSIYCIHETILIEGLPPTAILHFTGRRGRAGDQERLRTGRPRIPPDPVS